MNEPIGRPWRMGSAASAPWISSVGLSREEAEARRKLQLELAFELRRGVRCVGFYFQPGRRGAVGFVRGSGVDAGHGWTGGAATGPTSRRGVTG